LTKLLFSADKSESKISADDARFAAMPQHTAERLCLSGRPFVISMPRLRLGERVKRQSSGKICCPTGKAEAFRYGAAA